MRRPKEVATLEIQLVRCEVAAGTADDRRSRRRSVGARAPTTARAISSCTANTSFRLRSYDSDQNDGVIGGAHELRGHLESLTGSPDAALEHRGDAERVGNGAHCETVALERERGREPGDFEIRDLAQRADQLVREAVAEVLVRGVANGAGEGDHRNGCASPIPTPAREAGDARSGGAPRRSHMA